MKWPVLILGTLLTLLITMFVLKLTQRRETKPSYEQLKKERDALLFVFAFIMFWMAIVSWRVVQSGSDYWVGVAYVAGFAFVYILARMIYGFKIRRNTHEPRIES